MTHRSEGRCGALAATRRALAALALCLAAVGLAQPPFGEVAFVDPQGRLARIDPNGGDPILLTQGDGRVQFPAWSPDGRGLAAIRTTARGGAVTVFTFEGVAAGGSGVEVYESPSEPPFYLYWSPDARAVSFLANHPEGGIALHLASADGTDERVLATGSPFYWDWTDDGERMLVHVGFAGAGSSLGFLATDDADGGPVEVENLAEPGFFQAPGISADGRYLAFASAGGRRLVEVRSAPLADGPADGPEVERELPHVGLVALGWSPARDLLAVMRPTADVGRLIGPISVLDAETGLLEVVTDENALAFFWSPDGGHLAFLTLADENRSREFAGDAPPGASLRTVSQPVVQPASQPVAQGIPRLDLMVADLVSDEDLAVGAAFGFYEPRLLASFTPSPLFLAQFLPFFDQYALSHRLWAPDSSALVLPMLDRDGAPVVTLVGLDGSRTPLATGDTPFFNVR